MQPIEVRAAGGFDSEDEELRGLIAVQLKQAGLEGGELIGAGFEQEKSFSGGFDLALPAVDGLRGGNQRGAGGQPLLNQSAAQARGLVGTGRGGEDDAGWGTGFGHRTLPQSVYEGGANGWLILRLAVGFREGLVGRGRRPSNNYQEDIEDEERDGEIVEDRRLMVVWPELVGRPEEKCGGQQDRFEPLPGRRPMNTLVQEVGKRNQGKRQSLDVAMGAGRQQRRDQLPRTG